MHEKNAVSRPQTQPWHGHASSYRAREMQILAGWICAGASGMVLGLSGCGKSNLFDFLCQQPDALTPYLAGPLPPTALIPMKLGNLPDESLSTFFRSLLRAFHRQQMRPAFDLQEAVGGLYRDVQSSVDPFTAQSALFELLAQFEQNGMRVVFVLDGLDGTSPMLTAEMGRALRGLYDEFRDTVSYIAGARRGPDTSGERSIAGELGMPDDLHRLLSTHVCYVGPLSEDDARRAIAHRLRTVEEMPTAEETELILALTGGYPTLLKAVCRWRLLATEKQPLAMWRGQLGADPSIRRRLQSIWSGLSRAEQDALFQVQRTTAGDRHALSLVEGELGTDVDHLCEIGICRIHEGQRRPFGLLFADYVAEVGGARGKIWLDEATDELYLGDHPLGDLTPKERTVLRFFIAHPHRRHAYTDVIVAAWDDKERYHGVTNDSLFQVIAGLRRKIEPDPSVPIHVVNYRDKPEGGYIFYAEDSMP